ncbi:hypothetical protein [Cupriavidus metallidurans]|uniref:hypothetical protein n=1 Tax=Cupriavidus metallidurans TaxID=119219 RepID=UPI00068BB213|nr:hypothetical protein [Cupriavidus metallidurans]
MALAVIVPGMTRRVDLADPKNQEYCIEMTPTAELLSIDAISGGSIDMHHYTLDEHRHRFAVWAAGRAYSRGGSGGGYTVQVARSMLEAAGMRNICSVKDLPAAEEIDVFIDELIQKVMGAAPPTYITSKEDGDEDKKKVELPFICTYGRAQKLVNIYLKSKLICASAGHDDPRLAKLHPPLDNELLKELDRLARKADASQDECSFKALWKNARARGTSWTAFDKVAYDAYIAAIKARQGSQPLWAVEEHWKDET